MAEIMATEMFLDLHVNYTDETGAHQLIQQAALLGYSVVCLSYTAFSEDFSMAKNKKNNLTTAKLGGEAANPIALLPKTMEIASLQGTPMKIFRRLSVPISDPQIFHALANHPFCKSFDLISVSPCDDKLLQQVRLLRMTVSWCQFDRSIDWSIDLSIEDWLMSWLIDWLIDGLCEWFNCWWIFLQKISLFNELLFLLLLFSGSGWCECGHYRSRSLRKTGHRRQAETRSTSPSRGEILWNLLPPHIGRRRDANVVFLKLPTAFGGFEPRRPRKGAGRVGPLQRRVRCGSDEESVGSGFSMWFMRPATECAKAHEFADGPAGARECSGQEEDGEECHTNYIVMLSCWGRNAGVSLPFSPFLQVPTTFSTSFSRFGWPSKQ